MEFIMPTVGTTRVENGTTVCRMPEGSTLTERIESVIFWLEAQRDEYPNDNGWTNFTANALDEMKDLSLLNQEGDAAAIASHKLAAALQEAKPVLKRSLKKDVVSERIALKHEGRLEQWKRDVEAIYSLYQEGE